MSPAGEREVGRAYLGSVVPCVLRTSSDLDVRGLAKGTEIVLELGEADLLFEEKIPLYVEAAGLGGAFDLK